MRTGFKLVALMDGRALAVGGLTKPNVASSTAEVPQSPATHQMMLDLGMHIHSHRPGGQHQQEALM